MPPTHCDDDVLVIPIRYNHRCITAGTMNVGQMAVHPSVKLLLTEPASAGGILNNPAGLQEYKVREAPPLLFPLSDEFLRKMYRRASH